MADADLSKVLQRVLGFLRDLDEKTEDIRQSQFASKILEGGQGKPSAMASPAEGGRNARRYTQILSGQQEAPPDATGSAPSAPSPATPEPPAGPHTPPIARPAPRKAAPLPEIPAGGDVYEAPPAPEEEGHGLFGFAKPPRKRRRKPAGEDSGGEKGEGRRERGDGRGETRQRGEGEFAPGDPLRKLFRKKPSRDSLPLDKPPEEEWITAEGIAKPAPPGSGGRFPRAKPIPKAMPIAERILRRPVAKRLTSPWDFLGEYERDRQRRDQGPEFEPAPEEEQTGRRKWWQRLGFGTKKGERRREREERREDEGEGRRERGDAETRSRRRGERRRTPDQEPEQPSRRGLGDIFREMMAPHFARAMAGGGAAARLGGELFQASKAMPGGGGGLLRGVGAILAGGGMGKGGAIVGGILGGGAGGAMGGAAAGAMAASAAFGPLAGLAAIATGLGAAFSKLRESALETNQGLSQFSGALNIGQHGLERQQLIEQVRTARGTSGTGAAFLESEIARTKAMQPLQEMGAHISNLGGMLKNALENLLLETSGVNSLLRVANRYLASIAGNGKESQMPFMDFLRSGVSNELGGPFAGNNARGMASATGAGRMRPGQGFGPGIPRGGGGGGFQGGQPPAQGGLAGGAAPLHRPPGHEPTPGRPLDPGRGAFGGANMAPQAPAQDAEAAPAHGNQEGTPAGQGAGAVRRPNPMTPQERRKHQLETARRRAGSGSPAHTAVPTTGEGADKSVSAIDQSAEDAAQGKNRVPGAGNFTGLPKLGPAPESAIPESSATEKEPFAKSPYEGIF